MGWFCLVVWIILVDVLGNLFVNVLVDVLVDVLVGWLIWWLDIGLCFVQLCKHNQHQQKFNLVKLLPCEVKPTKKFNQVKLVKPSKLHNCRPKRS